MSVSSNNSLLAIKCRLPYYKHIYVEFTEVFMDSTYKRKCSSRKNHHGYAAFISDDENNCRLEEQRKETVYTHYLCD